MARVFSFLIRYFSNYYTLHRSDLKHNRCALIRCRFNNININVMDVRLTLKKRFYCCCCVFNWEINSKLGFILVSIPAAHPVVLNLISQKDYATRLVTTFGCCYLVIHLVISLVAKNISYRRKKKSNNSL